MSSRQGTFLLVVAVVCALAFPAMAVDTTSYPHVLLDSSCTDANDAPAASAGGSIKPAPQTAGPADGFCDHDSRILTGALTADTVFAPLYLPSGAMGILVYTDADAVSNDTDTWTVRLRTYRTFDDVTVVADQTASQATEGNKSFGFMPFALAADSGSITAEVDVVVPRKFAIELELVSATSWTGDIFWDVLY